MEELCYELIKIILILFIMGALNFFIPSFKTLSPIIFILIFIVFLYFKLINSKNFSFFKNMNINNYKNKILYLISLAIIQICYIYYWFLYFYKYPLFHSNLLSYDPIFHMRIIKELNKDSHTLNILYKFNYPIILHLTSFSLIKLFNYNPAIVRYWIITITALMPLFIWYVILLASEQISQALISSILITLVYNPFFQHIYAMGTYTNVYENFLALILIGCISSKKWIKNKENKLILFIYLLYYALSHTFSIILISAIFLTLIIFYRKDSNKRKLIYLIIISGFLYLLMIFHRNYLNSQIIVRIIKTGRLIYNNNNKYKFLQSIPYFMFMFNEYGILLSITSIIAVIYSIIYIIKAFFKYNQYDFTRILIKIWLLILFFMPFFMPHSSENIRIVLESIIPLSIIISEMLVSFG